MNCICPVCGGTKSVHRDFASERERSMQHPTEPCGFCNGTGEVSTHKMECYLDEMSKMQPEDPGRQQDQDE